MELSFEHEIEVGDETIMVDITYEVSGKRWEGLECEIQEVAYRGILLDYNQQEILTLCWENYHEE